ncbi:MAG TPA: tetraacyldisaccharide 4'-kinase, partial [Pantoea agglomerans]|nr:tetraacyldisaccharide 4'-kinase [Pantoea agglomerans]
KQLLIAEKEPVKFRHFAHPDWWYLPVDAHLTGNAFTPFLDAIEQLFRHIS